MVLPRLFAAMLCMTPIGAVAHELWIEPLSYQVDAGEKLQGHFKNGQEFAGSNLSFFDRSSARFEMMANGKTTVISPRSGDSPALDVLSPVKEGLVSVVYETTASLLTYREWEKFLKFAAHKDFPNAQTDHIEAGWPQDKFRESYTRHAKALIGVGNAAGSDVVAGLETEFLAITNPYDARFDNNMKVSLLYKGAPRANAQVEVFARAPDDTVEITLYRTDGNGYVSVPVQPGHDYLFDAVVLRPFANPVAEENPVVWETLWAALTFSVPE